MKIGILTDSTCDLPPAARKKNNIEVVPLSVRFSDRTYLDGVDITAAEFFEKLEESDELPGTSQPSVGLFMEKYREMSREYDAVISIHISRKLSGTIESAQLAAEQVDDLEIEIIDSGVTTLSLGFIVLLAAHLVEQNFTLEAAIDILKQARKQAIIYFTVSDLKYLEKGGRIGKAQALLGSILNFNPIMTLKGTEGEVVPLEKVRGNRKTRKRLVELCQDEIEGERKAWVGVLHGSASEEALQFEEEMRKELNEYDKSRLKVEEGIIGPVIGCHTGPSVFGFAVLKGEFLNHAD